MQNLFSPRMIVNKTKIQVLSDTWIIITPGFEKCKSGR